MISSDKKGVQVIINQCVANGMRHVVCSPGSRNAPLVIAMDEHPEIECLVIHDERSAAFFALGMAQQLMQPVGIVCTSGSAALNYYPAVAEAYYQGVPLVVITADRPAEWIDQGDGQTIVQKDVYKNHIRYSCDFSESVNSADQLWFLEREIAVAFCIGNGTWKGPIHFNISLSEPLYSTVKIQDQHSRIIRNIQSDFTFSKSDQNEFEEILDSKSILVLCGQLDKNDHLLKELTAFAKNTSVVVLVENTSNLVDANFIHCIDRTLNRVSSDEIQEFIPEVLITLGGAVVSKKIKQFLRDYKPEFHIRVGYDFPYMDTYQCLSHSIETKADQFFSALNSLEYKKDRSDFGTKWKKKDLEAQSMMPVFFENVEFADLSVFNEVMSALPKDSHLHMANSSVVRYCQLFDPKTFITYWSNRGTSGIDGSSSTACGAAYADKTKMHTLITGDISFFYDSNAFWNNYLRSNLRVVLINNGGGGIFKIIPGPSSSGQLEKYFEAKHQYTAKGICETFDIAYQSCSDLKELKIKLETFFVASDNMKPKLLEIMTPSEFNHLQLKDFFDFTKEFSN